MGTKTLITPLYQPHSGQSFNKTISISAFGQIVNIHVTSERELNAVLSRLTAHK